MRDYGKVSATFWTGETGKAIRKRGSEGVIVAVYLMTAPLSNMLGLYYQPLLFMAHETGLGIEGASKGLLDCIECGFCDYDTDSDTVWVFEMAAYQIAEALKASDKRCAGIQKDYDGLPDNPFLGGFFDRYHEAFHLKNRRAGTRGKASPFEAPPKPGAGTGTGAGTGAGIPPVPPEPHRSPPDALTADHTPSQQGLACRALREAGLQRVNPGHPTLAALLAAGATIEELVAIVPDAQDKGEPFSYLLEVAVKRRERAAKQAAAMHKGQIPAFESTYAREQRERAEAFAPGVARRAPQPSPRGDVIEAEVTDVTPRAVG